MGALLGVIILLVCAYYLSRSISDAAGTRSRAASRSSGVPRAARGGTVRSVLSAAAHPGSGQARAKARADTQATWHKAMAADWLHQRDHERKNGTANGQPAATPGAAATSVATKPGLRQRLRLKLAPFDAVAQSPAGNGNGQRPPNGTSQPAAQGNGGPPARQSPAAPAQASPPSTDGGTTVAGTSGAAAEKMTEGIQEIYARAASGGLTAKQEAVRAAHEAAVKFAGMMQMLARTMSEPGSNYGPEITEPLTKAGQHFQAGAMSLSEADTNLETLANMTLREASTSPRQVPHHQNELSESGRH